MNRARRWPAEWEAQAGILLAWPHANTDWAANLEAVEGSYRELIRAILGFEDVYLIVPDATVRTRAVEVLGRGIELIGHRLHWIELPYNDTWLRDSGPITVYESQGATDLRSATASRIEATAKPRRSGIGSKHTPIWLDFRFTGWGDKFEADLDDAIVAGLSADPRFADIYRERIDFALEGGAVETDGAGTLLTTWTCWSRRHPGKSRAQVEQTLGPALSVDRFLWLTQGELAGDDTDAHIDTLARFCAKDRIAYQACTQLDDPHFPALDRMAHELMHLRTRQGQPFDLYPLPWAPPIYAADGRRLAASYANFLIVNGGILMPGYDVDTDLDAAEVIQTAFPDHDVVIVPCRPLIEQNGSLHCVTMQLPEGVAV